MEGSAATARDLAHLKELIEDIKVAMVTTADTDGTLRSRPLQTVGIDDDCTVWFFTSQTSPKVNEAEADAGRVNVSYASPAKQDYVSISGRARLVRDPDLALMRIDIEKAEYWDSPATAVGRLYALSKGLATHNPDAIGENRKINV